MKQFYLKALVLCLGLLTGMETFAYQYVDGIYYDFNNIDMTATVTYGYNKSGSYSADDIVIPSSVVYADKTYNVTTIGEYAFYNCKIKSITIPNSISKIESLAFSGCTNLTSIEIPNSVMSIGYDAFKGCTGLEKVIIPDIAAWCGIDIGSHDESNPLYYAKHLYSDENTEIKNLIIPNGVTSIAYCAFQECIGLTSIEIPNSVTSIGQSAFQGCTGLTSIEIPNSVTTIPMLIVSFYN